MSNVGKAAVLGGIAGAVSGALYVSTSQHIVILAPYIVLMLWVAVWLFREGIAPFWSRVVIALTAFAATTLILWAVDIAKSSGQIIGVGVIAGLGKAFLLGFLVSVGIASISRRWQNGRTSGTNQLPDAFQ